MRSVKENLHEIIDSIEDEALLESIDELLEAKRNQQPGTIRESLTPEQQKSIVAAEQEIPYSPEKHVSHDEMKQRNKK